MPIIRDTHKWKPRQKFYSLTEESKEVGEQSVVCSERQTLACICLRRSTSSSKRNAIGYQN